MFQMISHFLVSFETTEDFFPLFLFFALCILGAIFFFLSHQNSLIFGQKLLQHE